MRFSLISKHPELSYHKVSEILHSIQDDVRKISNRSVQLAMEWYDFASDYKKSNGDYPTPSSFVGYKSIDGYVYHRCTEEFGTFTTRNLNVITRNICGKIKNEINDIRLGKRSIPSYQENQPIPIDNQTIKIKNNDGVFEAEISILSKSGTNKYELSSGRFKFLVKIDSPSQRQIITRLGSEYKLSQCMLIYDDKKRLWHLNLGYSFESKKLDLDKDKILGIDMGTEVPLVAAINSGRERMMVKVDEIKAFRDQKCRRRNAILNGGKWCGDGRRGHGRDTRISPIDTMSHKVSNFRNQWNHKISKAVVEFAIKNKCATIQMENLTGISSKSKFLKSWSFYDLQTKITYKAKEVGIDVRLINPKYTSQRCSRCGNITSENRDKRNFLCTECGYKAHADYNAAKNISMKDIELIIKNGSANPKCA